jgi:thiamine-monophosphate kinase
MKESVVKTRSEKSGNPKGLGERQIIEIIKKRLDLMPKMPVPFGDDVSGYDLEDDRLAVLKTDMLVDKTDVPPGMSLWQAARKAVVMNVSDFASKGVKPLVILVALGLPGKVSKKDVVQVADGLNAGAREYGAYVVGGDTGEASDTVISLSVFGIAEKGRLMLRSGAKIGDHLAVTGEFGKSAAGLKLLLSGLKAKKRIRDVLVDSVLMPRARLKEGLVLAKSGAVSASIDSSDGLAWSLHEIARSSNVGFLVERVPVAEEVKRFAKANGLDPLGLALYGGEEYELVVTVKKDSWERAENAVKNAGGELLRIGKVTSYRKVLLQVGRRKQIIEARGYEHFRSF